MSLAFAPMPYAESSYPLDCATHIEYLLVSFHYGIDLARMAAECGRFCDLDAMLEIASDFAEDYDLGMVRDGITHYEVTHGVKIG